MGLFTARVLEHDQRKVSIRRNHNLMLLRSNSDECNLFVAVESADSLLGFGGELGDERAVLNGVFLAHGGLNGDTGAVYNNDTHHTHVGVNPIQGFLDFLRHF